MTQTAIEATVTERPKKNGAGAAAAAPKSTVTKLMNRATSTERGEATLRLRKMKLTISKDVCTPGAFDDDFVLIVQAPSTEIELAAFKKYATENPGAIPHEMCRLCLLECDGQRLSDADLTRDAVWEALGSTGRSLVLLKWNELSGGAASQEALKKMGETTAILV